MTVPNARVLKDSISPGGARLTTMEVTCHRFVLAEFNTHRQFSRNSASSRAIPVERTLQRVWEDPAIPVSFPIEQKGMQGGVEVDGQQFALARWLDARDAAARSAERMVQLNIHKSVVNRLIEPFMWHTIVVSSTEWQNFFDQRCSPLAQPEMRAAAEAMKEALWASIPEWTPVGQWHLPFMDGEDLYACKASGEDPRMVSSARCARVSYLTHGGKRDVQEDAAMAQRLADPSDGPPHASPFEHVATPIREIGQDIGNFRGWRQFRHEKFVTPIG